MVVTAHRVARDTLALDSSALSPTTLPGTNPQPHLLLMSLIVNKTANELGVYQAKNHMRFV